MLMPSYNLAAKFLMLQIVDRTSVPVPCFEAIAANSFFQGRDRSFHAIYSLPSVRHSAVSVFHGYIVQYANRLVIEHRMEQRVARMRSPGSSFEQPFSNSPQHRRGRRDRAGQRRRREHESARRSRSA